MIVGLFTSFFGSVFFEFGGILVFGERGVHDEVEVGVKLFFLHSFVLFI